MSFIIRKVVRWKLKSTSMMQAIEQAQAHRDVYVNLAEQLTEEQLLRSVLVPPMRGVDENMRAWSFYELLEHNAIVNRAMSSTIEQLLKGVASEDFSGAAVIDAKHDVLPNRADPQALPDFLHSIDEHLSLLSKHNADELKRTGRSKHPLFGSFNAHMWSSMFSFHLEIHLKQAKCIVELSLLL